MSIGSRRMQPPVALFNFGVWPQSLNALPQTRVEARERGVARAELCFAERVERRFDRAEDVVRVGSVGIDVKQSRHDLTEQRFFLHEARRAHAIAWIVLLVQLAQSQR